MIDVSTPPVLRLVRGDAAPDEVAAIVAVLAALRPGAPSTDAVTATIGGWRDPAASLRRPLRPGVGAWRASTFPR